jgi:hypothetical protein
MQRILEKIQGVIGPWAHEFLVLATSWWALRAYVIIAALAVLAASFWIAQRQRTWLLSLSPGNFDRSFRGPKPKREDSIKRRLHELHAFKNSMLRSAASSLAWLILFGLAIPSALVILGTQYYGWFDPSGHILVDDKLHPLSHPGTSETFWFVASQLSLGVVGSPASFAGTFGLHVPNVSFDQVNPVSDAVVLAYRYFVGVFGGVFGHFVLTLIRVARTTGPKDTELREALSSLSAAR